MQPAGQGHPPLDGEEAEHMAGDDDAAVDLDGHGRRQQQVDAGLYRPQRGILPSEQGPVPPQVQGVVGQK